MKRALIHSFSLIAVFICSLFQPLAAQPVSSGSKDGSARWSVNPFDIKVFIENKGQFDGMDNLPASNIYYGVDDHGAKIYFTAKGLTWRFDKVEVPQQTASANGGEAEPEEFLKQVKTKTYTLNMEFLNSNPGVEIIAEDVASGYYNYMDAEKPALKSIYYAKAYRKLVYKEVYPGIDIEYTFHKDEGIKYALILHAGADVSKVLMKYSGADKVFLDKGGDIHFTTAIGDIVDHAPETFYADDKSPVASSFQINGNTVAFKLDNYDPTREVVIDPWTAAPNYLSSNVKSYYIKRDHFGNIYVYGGDDHLRLFKYSYSGTVIWTLTSTYNISGGLAVDSGGNSYISGSLSPGSITRVNNAGIIDTITYPGYGGSECWAMAVSCDNATAYMGGGPPVGIQALNPLTGDTVNSIRPLFPAVSQREIRAMTVAPNNNIYVLTNAGDLSAIDPSLNIIYINTGVVLTYYGPAYSSTYYGSGGPNFFHAGVNGIAADNNYVYFTNGFQLYKAAIATGNTIASTIISGGNYNENAGIAVDGCGNIYVGALGLDGLAGKVSKYDSTLTFVASLTTTGAVYDVCLGDSGSILAAGNGFIASLDFADLACPPYTLSCAASILPPTANYTVSDSAFCAGDCVSLTNLSQNATSYQWIFPGGTPSSSTSADPQNICYYAGGNYSVKLFAYNDGGSDSLVLDNYIRVNAAPPTPGVTQTGDTLFCSTDSSYSAYQWYDSTTLISGATNAWYVATHNGNYNVKVTNGSGCTVGVGINVIINDIQQFTSSSLQLIISPNPVGNQFTVYDLLRGTKQSLTIFNVLGEKVYDSLLPTSNSLLPTIIDVSSLSSGIYFVRITNERQSLTGKFVKE